MAPALEYGSSSSDVFNDGRRMARLGYSGRSASLVLGRQLGNWGDLQVGLTRQKISARVVLPEDPNAQIVKAYDSTQFLRYRIDTLDSLGFPSRGFLLDAEMERSPTGTDGQSLARSAVIGLAAFHTANWAGHVYGEWAHTQRGTAPLTLGGFLRLSGTANESVQGRSIAFSRLVMARRIGALPITLGGTVRAGFSLEMGGGYDRDQPVQAKQFKQAGSAFLSVDTRFGPVYFGAGGTKEGDRTLYLFLGPIW